MLYCKCSCGNIKWFYYGNLVSGSCQSCGCLKKEQLRKQNWKPLGHATLYSVYGYYKRNARLRNIEFKLTWEEFKFLLLKNCYYCGIIGASFRKMKYGDYARFNGVDRLDNDLGYLSSNSVSCCKECNQAKNDRSVTQFKSWVERIYGNLFHK